MRLQWFIVSPHAMARFRARVGSLPTDHREAVAAVSEAACEAREIKRGELLPFPRIRDTRYLYHAGLALYFAVVNDRENDDGRHGFIVTVYRVSDQDGNLQHAIPRQRAIRRVLFNRCPQ